MIARLTSPCICGAIVTPGMKIGYDGEIRKVVMCPACAPKRRKAQAGKRYPVKVRGSQITVCSLRLAGEVVALSFRWTGMCGMDGWARYAVDGGEWKLSACVGDAPTWLTDADVREAIAQAAKAHRAAA